MCCFAGPVRSVANTRIFARLTDQDRQLICYQMEFDSISPNAMILPLPAKPNAGESSIRFIDLSSYGNFFDDMERGFPEPQPRIAAPGGRNSGAVDSPMLEVHEVGDFIASFVPQMKDFDRLDPQFAIPSSTWSKIPAYSDFSFAVFQLKELQGSTHPMAFEFETRHPDRIFFPTVHIHDGEVHEEEDFEHHLYCQHVAYDQVTQDKFTNRTELNTGLVRSKGQAGRFMNVAKSQGIVDGRLAIHRKEMHGRFQNQDVVLQPELATPISYNVVPDWRWLTAASSLLPLAWILKRRMDLTKRPVVEN